MSNSKKVSFIDAAQTSDTSATVSPFISIEEVAARLRTDAGWVREKIRRRCPNQMPVINIGRHLLFEWSKVEEWVRNTPRPLHAAHRRRWKKKPKSSQVAPQQERAA
jgi:excisionase family DNA binding protein